MTVKFTNLHVHSSGSLLDGMIKVDELIQFCLDENMDSCAITDHGTLFNAFTFYEKATAAGIKPIIGCEVYVKAATFNNLANLYHLTLLATNETGYHNLLKLVTSSFVHHFYFPKNRPTVDKELLKRYSGGLIALSGCLQGEIPHTLLSYQKISDTDALDRAHEILNEYLAIFPNDCFYLELMDNGLEDQNYVNKMLEELSLRTNVKTVLTSDGHYLRPEDQDAHEVLLCLQTKKTLLDENRFSFKNKGLSVHLLTPDLVAEITDPVLLKAAANTQEVADKVNIHLTPDKDSLPAAPSIKEDSTPTKTLEYLCKWGLVDRLGGEIKDVPPEYRDRLHEELEVINGLGFANYFLIVHHYVGLARRNNIMVSPGRGSAGGSLVAYALGITQVDPLQYKLPFSRFLNEGRIGSTPDIDLDFSPSGRIKLINLLKDIYGENCVVPIGTHTMPAGKMAVRDVARTMGYDYSVGNDLANAMPEGKRGKSITIKQALNNKKFQKEIADNEDYQKIIQTAKKIEGIIRSTSMHAGGVVITKEPVQNWCPLTRVTKQMENKTGIKYITQYSMKPAEKVGLIKFDILALDTIELVERCLQAIYDHHGITIDVNTLARDDQPTYKTISKGYTMGVFQLESEGMTSLCKDVHPTRLEELGDLIALYRPGPIDNGLTDLYVENRQKPADQWTKMSLPADTHYLFNPTQGIMLYQEQIMGLVQHMAKASSQEADSFRKAVGKKDREKMKSLKSTFIRDAIQKGNYTETEAKNAFTIIANNSDYLFNRSHSILYCLMSYTTAYFKTHYPALFLASYLNTKAGANTQAKEKTIRKALTEANRLGIKVTAPDVTISEVETTVQDNTVIMGLNSIKGFPSAFASTIVEERKENGRYINLMNLCKRTFKEKNFTKPIELLAKIGALRSFPGSRMSQTAVLPEISKMVSRHYRSMAKNKVSADQLDLFSGKDTIIDTGPTPINIKDNLFDNYRWEQDVFGTGLLTRHPLEDCHLPEQHFLFPTGVLNEETPEGWYEVVGLVREVKVFQTKQKKQMMANVFLEDADLNEVRAVVFPKTYGKIGKKVRNAANRCVKARTKVTDKKEVYIYDLEVLPLVNQKEPEWGVSYNHTQI